MAHYAISPGHWAVDKFLIRHVVFMAVEADIWKRFFGEQKLVVRLMGIMTDYAFTFLNRQMYGLVFKRFF
jgi:hypothetical protein